MESSVTQQLFQLLGSLIVIFGAFVVALCPHSYTRYPSKEELAVLYRRFFEGLALMAFGTGLALLADRF